MFSCYSDDDITKMADAVDALLAENDILPDSVKLHILANAIERNARELAKAYEAADRMLHEPDLVNRLETCAGIIDHGSPRIQCRGETTMHRLYEEEKTRADALQARLDTAERTLAMMET